MPTTLNEMENIGPVADSDLTVEDILVIAEQHGDLAADAEVAIEEHDAIRDGVLLSATTG